MNTEFKKPDNYKNVNTSSTVTKPIVINECIRDLQNLNISPKKISK